LSKILSKNGDYVEAGEIDDGEKLQGWLNGADRKFELIDEQLSGIVQVNKGAWRETEPDTVLSEQLGHFARAVMRRDDVTLGKMGALRSKWEQGDLNAKIYPIDRLAGGTDINSQTPGTKANLGTILSGDDSEGTGGQYLLPQTLYESLVLRTPFAGGSGVVSRCRNVTMPGRLMRYPTTGTEFSFTHVTNEATDKTEVIPTFSYKDLECETYAGYFSVTDELMDDQIIDIGSIMREEAIEALAVDVIEEQILNSDSAPSVGALNNTSTVSYNMDSTSFDGIEWDDLHGATALLTQAKQRRGGVFVMHPTVWDILVDKKNAVGTYYFDPAIGPPMKAFSYPVLLSEVMPQLSETATATPFIIFGNLTNCLHGTRIGLEMRYYNSTMYSVTSDQNFFRIRTRQAFVVGIPANLVRITTAAS